MNIHCHVNMYIYTLYKLNRKKMQQMIDNN